MSRNSKEYNRKVFCELTGHSLEDEETIGFSELCLVDQLYKLKQIKDHLKSLPPNIPEPVDESLAHRIGCRY
jgi:hypothetical protein